MLNVRHSISMHDIYETCIDQYKPFIRHVATATSNTKNVRSDESDGCNNVSVVLWTGFEQCCLSPYQHNSSYVIQTTTIICSVVVNS